MGKRVEESSAQFQFAEVNNKVHPKTSLFLNIEQAKEQPKATDRTEIEIKTLKAHRKENKSNPLPAPNIKAASLNIFNVHKREINRRDKGEDRREEQDKYCAGQPVGA